MPDWSSSVLTLAGQPEDLADFLVSNGQSCEPDSYTISQDAQLPMNVRTPADLHFSAFIPINHDSDRGTMKWGTKWDLGGQSYFGNGCKSHIQAEGLPTPFRSILEYNISTAWNPPSGWFDYISHQFKTVGMVMTSDDGSDSTAFFRAFGYGGETEFESHEAPSVPESDQEEDEDSDDHVSPEEIAARAQADRLHAAKLEELTPAERGLPQIILDIHLDRTERVEQWYRETPDRINALIDGLWAPIHHAAHSGAVGVFAELINGGADATVRGRNGLGVVDYLTDERGNTKNPNLATGPRVQMLEVLAQAAPDVLDMPLATGLRPIELAARYGMIDLLRVMVPKVDPGATSEVCKLGLDGAEESPGWLALSSDHAIGPARCVILNSLSACDSPVALDAANRFLETAMKPCRPAVMQDESVILTASQMLPATLASADCLMQLVSAHEAYEARLKTLTNVRDEEKLQSNDITKRELLRTVVRRMHAHLAIQDIEAPSKGVSP